MAQMVVKVVLEPVLEQKLHSDSSGHRLSKSTHDATQQARVRYWRWSWALAMDFKAYIDTADHVPLVRAVRQHTGQKWVLLNTEHGLKAPDAHLDGTLGIRCRTCNAGISCDTT